VSVGLTTYGLAVVAGGLSTLSPCVLPLIPILVASAVSAHRYGAFALALGLAVSFTVLGVLLASVGSSLGISEAAVRMAGAMLLLAFAAVLLSDRLQLRFAQWASTVSSSGQTALAGFSFNGLHGQALLGLLLGLVWTPCVGPTLGATITLASQGESLGQVMLTMALFGVGAGIPLILLGLVSRPVMTRLRGKLFAVGKRGKQILGIALLAIGIAILTGADKQFEAWALDHAPAWLIDLTTSI
jgi:cytochrome c biogenesis protein CcdA